MQHTMDEFQQHYTTAAKSAYQYFYDQSNGKFRPQFDLYGIYTLSSTRETYGAHGYYSNGTATKDVGRGLMVGEAVDLAQAEGKINWSNYDNDNDGICDVVIVVYAGVGEAQSSTTHPESIWPTQWDLYSASYYGDGTGRRTYNNTVINKFAVFNEIKGKEDSGGNLDGIGTFCHEFSHCLGLHDLYDTQNQSAHYGMGYWSILCSGCYNNNGDTPSGYSAYEKNSLGWLDLITPTPNTQYTLTAMNQKSEATDQAIKIVSDVNENEYFILENRKKQGWDQYLRGEGLLIHHITYDAAKFNSNTVNTGDIQLVTIVPADGVLSTATESGDTWGNTMHDFTNTSSPAATLNMTASGSITGSAGTLNKPINGIYVNDDGTVSLWYISGVTPTAPVLNDAKSSEIGATQFTASWTHESDEETVESYTMQVNIKKPSELLETADFSSVGTVIEDGDLANIADKASDYLPTGWSADGYLFAYNDHLVLHGDITTKPYDFSNYTKATVIVEESILGTSSYTCTLEVKSSVGSQIDTLTSATDAQHVYVIDVAGNSNESITIEGLYFPSIKSIKVYAGEYNPELEAAPLKAVSETGDADKRVITGITDKSYTVTGLTTDETYAYKVKAIYKNGCESDWSEMKTVTLSETTVTPGDVNEDGTVDVADVASLIAKDLGLNPSPFNAQAADLNGDGVYDVADVTLLIILILGM